MTPYTIAIVATLNCVPARVPTPLVCVTLSPNEWVQIQNPELCVRNTTMEFRSFMIDNKAMVVTIPTGVDQIACQ